MIKTAISAFVPEPFRIRSGGVESWLTSVIIAYEFGAMEPI